MANTLFYTSFVFLSVVLILHVLEEMREFQQMGYYAMPYIRHHKLMGIKADHLLFFIASLLLFFDYTILGTIFAFVSFVSQIVIFKNENPKHDLVYTKRVKRLFVPLLILFLLAIYNAITSNSYHELVRLAVLYAEFILLFAFTPVWIVLANLINRPMELMINNGYYKEAEKCVAEAPFLKVVAITGSYAKTSTKNMLGDMLKADFNTLVPPSSYNTKLGLTRLIREKLRPTTEILVAEMGAKKRGEILETVDMLSPDVSLITALSGQHLETFGDFEAIIKEKSQVFNGLKSNGTAIINIDDENIASISIKEGVDIVRISTQKTADIYAKDIVVNGNGLEFTLIDARKTAQKTAGNLPTKKSFDKDGGKAENNSSKQVSEVREIPLKTSLLGAHNVQNILAASAMALVLGAKPSSIQVAVKRLKPTKNRLSTRIENGVTILEDAFNSNPAGAKAALDVLSLMEAKKRLVVTPGMIELGDQEETIHKTFGAQIAKVADAVILVTKKQTKNIRVGLVSAGYNQEKITTVGGMRDALKLAREMTSAGDVVLIENDLPDAFEEKL